MKRKKIIHWTCYRCGWEASNHRSTTIQTYHEGKCEVCGETRPITEAKDFFHPDFTKLIKKYKKVKK